MDKNMIHIDDLVRQRLGGGQESERPGAWLTMRELLDKEMPVAVETATNWRRIIGYFTALLLLTTASVGGYKMYSGRVASNGGSGGGTGMESTGGGYVASSSSSNNSSNNKNNNSGTTEIASNIAVGNNATPSTDNEGANSNGTSTNTHRNGGSTRANKTGTGGRDANNQTSNVSGVNGGLPTDNQVNNPSMVKSANNSGNTYASNTGIDMKDLRRTANAEATGAALPKGANMPKAVDQSRQYAANSPGVTMRGTRNRGGKDNMSNNAQAGKDLALGSSGVQPKPMKVVTRSDSFRKVEVDKMKIVYHRVYDPTTMRSFFRLDTFPAGRMIIDRPIVLKNEEVAVNTPVEKKKHKFSFGHKKSADDNAVASNGAWMKTANDAAINPAAAPPKNVADADKSGLKALEDSRVSVKHFNLWNAEKFNDAVHSLKFKLAQVQMYPGVMGGINGSVFTPNSLGGFQLGLTSLFVLNDWWTLLAELKYYHRLNTGSTVRDDYKRIIDDGSANIQPTTVQGAPYNVYDWKDETVDHYFNYDVVRTFEVPLALRYSWGRFYSQGGLNFVFSSKIEAKEVSHNRGDIVSHHDLRPGAVEPFITNSTPLVNLTDFGSRFGTGYMIGGGFMFTPAVYLDLRVSQTFWDNASTYGAKQISRDLLRTPSFQLSVGYRFSQKH